MGAFKQRIGRHCGCSHHKYDQHNKLILKAAERKLSVKLYVATLPSASDLQHAMPSLSDSQAEAIAGSKTMDQVKLEMVLAQYVEFEDAQDFISKHSIEYGLV